jgi:hypothetical protein
MIIDRPAHPNGVWAVFDTRSLTDRQLQDAGATGNPVYRNNPLLRETFGREHANVTRIALFDHGVTPSANARRSASMALVEVLKQQCPAVVCVFPTPSSELTKEAQATKNTLAFAALKAPDSVKEMRGSFWEKFKGTSIVPMYPCVPVIDETCKAMNQRWARWAVAIARKEVTFINPQIMITQVDPASFAMLDAMRGKTLSVDIETIDSQGLITALGISAGSYAISLPYDRYQPAAPGLGVEAGIDEYGELGRIIKAKVVSLLADSGTVKVGQNFLYDIRRLEARGLKIGGKIEDTLAAHAIVYPTLKHGLQLACATEFAVRPWKSIFKVPGVKREDERFWRWEPAALRQYNALDSFNTLLLWESLCAKLA